MNDSDPDPEESSPAERHEPVRPRAYGPVHGAGYHRSRSDTQSAWMGNTIFFVGALFGMGLMLVILQLWPPDDEPDIAHYKEVREFVLENFVGDVDPKELVQGALDGMLDSLDEFSEYYVEGEIARVNRDTSGHFSGIGVVFRNRHELRQLLFPVPGSPAEEAGLRVGDVILAIDGQNIVGLPPEDVALLIQGPAGSSARFQVRGLDEEVREHEVLRRVLVDPSVRRIGIVDEARKVGYLAIVSFSNETVAEFDAAVAELQGQGMRALVIDLRDNRGGVLSAAVDIARRFVAEGRITSTEGRGLPEFEEADPDEAHYVGLPVVVLIDDTSASASEVLAGALQDHRMAVLVGTPTWGKGVVQTISRYPEHQAIAKVTSSYYYTPAHRNVGRRPEQDHDYGLVPDLEVPIDPAERIAIHGYLATYPPPPEALEALRAWEAAEGLKLVAEHPPDVHLDAALELLAGRNPQFEEETGP